MPPSFFALVKLATLKGKGSDFGSASRRGAIRSRAYPVYQNTPYLWANPQENERPNSSFPPMWTAARKAEANHFFMPAFVTKSL